MFVVHNLNIWPGQMKI